MAENGSRGARLYELLAVEKNLEGQAHKTRTELIKTFTDKRHLFAEKLVTFTANSENSTAQPEEQSSIQTTVREEIKWLTPILAKSLDASYQIDLANTLAKADIETEDGTTLLHNVPATSLLRMEHRFQEIHDLIAAIPTLDPAKGFATDTQRGSGIYKARDVKKFRTKKEFKPVVMVPPTKEHPAQVEKLYEDVPVGELLTQEWSALITPDTKAKLLNQCDQLSRAIKRALARANGQEVDVRNHKVAEKLLEYVFSPLHAPETATK